ncbi:hypothetical protein PAXRUDRAFT_174973 [Paxillus rubicundulus Ve08.2h10]|uniref:Uncharacterized protein n=1 Tax=Paxillus rubicundulus Ve08.2h10 TaxID=930991 RepID=A0A0D0BTA3_9AGAM|nr:hypothetical protein PAXRUDRAFT_174973 [Paxillus rubicundulus Ve08.2h10]
MHLAGHRYLYLIPPSFYKHPGEDIHGQYHTASGYLYGKGATLFDKMKADQHKRHREHVIYYPFADDGEWELAKFLAKHLTQTAINEFLRLKWFHKREKPSFNSAEQLLGWIDTLPSGPVWQCTTLQIQDCATTHPINLIWRDGKEVVEDILSNLIFANYMTFDPHVVMHGMEREYSEFFTGNRVHHIQDQLPEGATIIPIILASDKTPMTRHTGGLEMHPVFITIGNIQSDVRMQATSRTHPHFR